MNVSIRATPASLYPGSFSDALRACGQGALSRAPLQELQINVGRLCNQACEHCHVDAGPKRTEVMTRATMERIVEWAAQSGIAAVDITGGAPELNPGFRWLVERCREFGASVTTRCNLTVLLEPGQEDLAGWYAERAVRLVCSLPCYSAENVDKQRGRGVFDKSIRGLQRLNDVGYGSGGRLVLDLVYNPGGAFLPPAQGELEREYKRRLGEAFGIRFDHLLTLANLPINRFARYLERTDQRERYARLLWESFNPDTVDALMCRHLISVDWTGRVYDCDFNQMLDLPLDPALGAYLWEIDKEALHGARVAVGSHCFGCTAGAGSSCGGALT